jgi:hypothetical protein
MRIYQATILVLMLLATPFMSHNGSAYGEEVKRERFPISGKWIGDSEGISGEPMIIKETPHPLDASKYQFTIIFMRWGGAYIQDSVASGGNLSLVWVGGASCNYNVALNKDWNTLFLTSRSKNPDCPSLKFIRSAELNNVPAKDRRTSDDFSPLVAKLPITLPDHGGACPNIAWIQGGLDFDAPGARLLIMRSDQSGVEIADANLKPFHVCVPPLTKIVVELLVPQMNETNTAFSTCFKDTEPCSMSNSRPFTPGVRQQIEIKPGEYADIHFKRLSIRTDHVSSIHF